MDLSVDDGTAATQPLVDDEFDDQMADNDDGSSQELMDIDQAFGFLLPLQPPGPAVPIKTEIYTVGRSPKCQLQIPDSVKNFEAVSKVHFVIRTEKGRITLQDMSSNGTFVSGAKVGKEKIREICHNTLIGLTGPKNRNYVFMSASKVHYKMYPSELKSKYIMTYELGKGACGVVYLAVRRSDHKQLAIKVISKKSEAVSLAGLPEMNEVNLLKKIEHPCVIKLEDVIESDKNIYIALEYADGGELFDKIIEKTKLQEAEAKLYFYMMLSAIKYLHSENIAHRDLKPENILLCSADGTDEVIKVTDLGLSKFVDMHTHLKTFCGTPQYLAPEVLFSRVRGNGSYDLKVDMWSLGVILYILLSGHPPFHNDRADKPLIKQVTDGDYSFPTRIWGNISQEAKDLVKKLMTVDPMKRLSAVQALDHPWMKDQPIIDKAEELMEKHRLNPFGLNMEISCLNGILPPELDGSIKNTEWSETVELNGSGEKESTTFKRPNDENLTPSNCKRVRKD